VKAQEECVQPTQAIVSLCYLDALNRSLSFLRSRHSQLKTLSFNYDLSLLSDFVLKLNSNRFALILSNPIENGYKRQHSFDYADVSM
jgi:hypothetical protein